MGWRDKKKGNPPDHFATARGMAQGIMEAARPIQAENIASDLMLDMISSTHADTGDDEAYGWATDEINRRRGLALGIPASEQLLTYQLDENGHYHFSKKDMERIIDHICERVKPLVEDLWRRKIARDNTCIEKFYQGYDHAGNIDYNNEKLHDEARLKFYQNNPVFADDCREAMMARLTERDVPSRGYPGTAYQLRDWLTGAFLSLDQHSYDRDYGHIVGSLDPIIQAIAQQIEALEKNEPIKKESLAK